MTSSSALEERFSDRISNVPRSFLREILKFTSQPGIISFAGGLPNPTLFPEEALLNAAQKVLKEEGTHTLQYSNSEGYLPLRELIARRYYEKQGLNISPEEILITNGSQQGLDLLGKVLINPEDKILLEKPSYLGAIQAFSLYQPQFININLHRDGPDIRQLEQVLECYKIKLMYAVSDYQNPTGRQWSLEKRKLIGTMLAEKNILLAEDSPYGEIKFDDTQLPLLKQYAGDYGILLGSFSKVISPGLRVGWIAAHKILIEKLIIAKQASDLHTNLLSQKMISQFISNGTFDMHIETLKKAYKFQKDCMIREMKKEFPEEAQFEDPTGGMFIWVTLPEYIDTHLLFEQSIRQNVAFVPGKTFFPDGSGKNTMRLNYSNSNEEEIQKGIKILGKLIKENLK